MGSLLETAVRTLSASMSRSPRVEEAVRAWWGTAWPSAGSLDRELAAAADVLSRELPQLAATSDGVDSLRPLFEGPGAPVLLSWCSASAWRGNVSIAPLLALAAEEP